MLSAPLYGYLMPRFVPYAGIATAGSMFTYWKIKAQKNTPTSAPTLPNTPATQPAPSTFTLPTTLQSTYAQFKNNQFSQSYPKPLSGKFTARCTSTYPNNAEIVSANQDFVSLGFPTTQITKTYEKLDMHKNEVTHQIHFRGHIQCAAGDAACNNALYTLSNTRDFTRCMHYALSHPEIPRTQRCQSLFDALGSYGPNDLVIDTPVCKNAWWSFDVTLDND